MIDEARVRQMAQQYQMNPSLARRLLEEAQEVSALRIGRRSREMKGGNSGGYEHQKRE